ncbi:MAG: sugar ABC transporter substrate-binding protein [Chloroflexaceae bacterium]|jgi:multiple sugar transport system substrate-binding protein|nr:sugar ABC transporter substrate-binding protein [Chloroflexaceae bacterium]
MQWKKAFHVFAPLVAIMMVLASCATTPQTAPTAPAAPAGQATAAPAATTAPGAAAATAAPAAQATTAPAPAGATTIRWRTRPGDAAEQKVYEELNALVNEQLASKGITATYDPSPNQGYFEKLKTELAGGTAPDIFWIGGVELADFVNTGEILDLKPLMDKDTSFNIGDFYPNVIQELTRDGKIYGLPRDISTMVTYYNEDMFKAAGLKTPKELAAEGNWNWDTMLDAAKKLTNPDQQQYGLGFGNWWGPSWGYFVNAAGGSPFNADRTACGLTSPEAIAGATKARSLYDEKLIVPGDADGEALFNAGKVGMYFNGRWFTPGVRTNAQFGWDVAEMPQGKVKSTWLFWGPYLVNAKTTSPDAAWEVLKVLTSAEATGKVAALGTNIPPRSDQAAVDAFLGASPPANNQAFLAGVQYAALEAPVWAGSWADFSGGVQTAWDDMIAGQITPEEFAQTACESTASSFNK